MLSSFTRSKRSVKVKNGKVIGDLVPSWPPSHAPVHLCYSCIGKAHGHAAWQPPQQHHAAARDAVTGMAPNRTKSPHFGKGHKLNTMLFGKTLQCCYPLHLPKTQLNRVIELADEASSLPTHRLSLVLGRAPSHVHLGASAQDRPKAGQKERLHSSAPLCLLVLRP